MTKKEVQQRVLQNGKPLDLDEFAWDENTNTFSSNEDRLVIDFKGISDCTFNTGPSCTFNTGAYCTFKTGYNCTFNTGSYCTFDTGAFCTFDTGAFCVVVRRDVYEVIELKASKRIKLNGFCEKGYTVLGDDSKKQELLNKAQELIDKANELKSEAEKL